ncbi:MAG: Rne/Rng family ribonuclease [Clostridiales bacterium]|nr:Rne/Rng family ribonuclease [Clostridiales bacterium]
MKKETKKEWFLDRYCKQQFAALVEEGKLVEFSCENEPRVACVGNVYKGKVTNVLSGMNAAFINCGLAKNCYLSMEETYTDYSKYDGTMGEANQKNLDLNVGDEIIVQVTKPPRGNKGAKVTTHLSFVGKNVIFLPNTDFLGISRRIVDEALRAEALSTVEKMREDKNEGFIIRTQAPLATQKQLKAEVLYLKKLHLEMQKLAKTAPVGTLLYEDDDLPARVIRDCVGDEISVIHVGDETLYHRLSHLAKLRKDFPARKLKLHTGERSLYQEYGISPLITQSLSPKVPLDNGGYLVIDHTEAMTVVDVNTGSYVGETSLEETVFSVNLAAAKEIARQVRLRNVGGIVVVDFIDMVNEEHKTAVTEALRACLALDKAKCNVLPMSELCLTQFTRKRVGHETFSYYEKVCPHCEGSGYIQKDSMTIKNLRESILDCFADGYTAAIIDLHEGVLQKILGEGLFSIEAKNRWKDKRIYFIPHKTYSPTYFTVRGDNATVLTLPAKAQILY